MENQTKPLLVEVFSDNGEHSHWTLVNPLDGSKLWSESPEECKSMGYPVKQSVNEKLVEALKELVYQVEQYSKGEIATQDYFRDEIKIAKEAILSDFNQENNEGWISVEDRLPEKNGIYFIYDGIEVLRAHRRADKWTLETGEYKRGMYTECFTRHDWTEFVTHWMPLPKPPKEK